MRTGPKLVEIRSSPSSFRILTEFVRILDSFLFIGGGIVELCGSILDPLRRLDGDWSPPIEV